MSSNKLRWWKNLVYIVRGRYIHTWKIRDFPLSSRHKSRLRHVCTHTMKSWADLKVWVNHETPWNVNVDMPYLFLNRRFWGFSAGQQQRGGIYILSSTALWLLLAESLEKESDKSFVVPRHLWLFKGILS